MAEKQQLDTHDKLQELVDGSRLLRIGKATGDTESLEVGWKRVRAVRPPSFVKKLFDSLPGKEETPPPKTEE